MKTLLALSGGLDSTYLAFEILSKTDEELHCFFMDLRNVMEETPEGLRPYYNDLNDAEVIAAPRVIDWLAKNVRPVWFEVTSQVKYEAPPDDFPKGTARSWRVYPMLKYAARVVTECGFDRFIYGKSPENIRSPDWKDRADWYQKWWKENAPAGTTFETPLIRKWQGRPHALAALPRDLLALVLTCNDPLVIDGQPLACGLCDKCMLTLSASRMLADGVNPNGILEVLLQRRKAGDYITADIRGDHRFGADHVPRNYPNA